MTYDEWCAALSKEQERRNERYARAARQHRTARSHGTPDEEGFITYTLRGKQYRALLAKLGEGDK